jgi:hypothetical protein
VGRRTVPRASRYPESAVRWARLWFAVTALCVAAGVVISVYTAAHNHAGHFHTPVARAFNTFAFFTVDSNLIVGATVLLLALKPDRTSPVFATFRLIGVVAITVTGLVYHVALASLFDLQRLDQLGNQLVHTVVPILAVAGWLMFGPRRLTSARIALWSLVFLVAWLGFTLVRGAFVHWYPYPFIDVTVLGYGGTLLNCVWVSVLLLGLAAGRLASTVSSADPVSDAPHQARRSRSLMGSPLTGTGEREDAHPRSSGHVTESTGRRWCPASCSAAMS